MPTKPVDMLSRFTNQKSFDDDERKKLKMVEVKPVFMRLSCLPAREVSTIYATEERNCATMNKKLATRFSRFSGKIISAPLLRRKYCVNI